MFTIVMPMDTNRLEQFKVTKGIYDEMPQKKEFIIPTRSRKEVGKYLKENGLMKDVHLVSYKYKDGFNPSTALNLGVKWSKYENIIITSPEVKPTTDVLGQLSKLSGKNVVCEVSDQDESGNLTILVGEAYRSNDPSMYFLALFNRGDIEKINGWDEDFMKGYAYEDNDFGARWVRAGLPFEFHGEIKAVHQYHPRSETVPGGMAVNLLKFHYNNDHNVTYCENGLNYLEDMEDHTF